MLEHTLDCRERGLVHCDIGVVASEGVWETIETGTYLVIDVPGESLRLERRS